ncbi:hypothetical protein C8F04DRAFT_963553, partial [Mycena alexandri]
GLPWVAKRFINIGTGDGEVDIQENCEQVVKEAARLLRLGYFVKRFLAEAKRQSIDLKDGLNWHIIQVTDFKIAVEVVPDSGPSTASGFSLEQYQAAQKIPDSEDSEPVTQHTSNPSKGLVVWLFEPRRSSKVQRWSGTNEYPPWARSKLGSTLNTFAHYAYIVSHESTVFCDLQSMPFPVWFPHYSTLMLCISNCCQRGWGGNGSFV